MKALTLTQPYASLIAIGAKTIETRDWATKYRGPLAIHAGKGLGPVGGRRGMFRLCNTSPFAEVLDAAAIWHTTAIDHLPYGAIVAVVELVDCRPTAGTRKENGWGPKYADWVHDLTAQERAFGDYTPGRYGWMLTNIRALPMPIAAKGALSLWEWDPPTERTV